MNQLIILDKPDIITLKSLDIGPRIRFIREKLRKELGPIFSIRSVVKRIGGISPAAFASIERGDTKEPSARLLHSIANDFGINLEIFFDDYYNDDIDEIKLNKQSNTITNSNVEYKSNALNRNKNKLGFYIYEENMNGEKRRVFEGWTTKPVDNTLAEQLIASIISHIDTINLSMNEGMNLNPAFNRVKKRFEAQMEHPYAFPWIPKDLWNHFSNELNKEAVNLMKQKMKTKEEEE